MRGQVKISLMIKFSHFSNFFQLRFSFMSFGVWRLQTITKHGNYLGIWHDEFDFVKFPLHA